MPLAPTDFGVWERLLDQNPDACFVLMCTSMCVGCVRVPCCVRVAWMCFTCVIRVHSSQQQKRQYFVLMCTRMCGGYVRASCVSCVCHAGTSMHRNPTTTTTKAGVKYDQTTFLIREVMESTTINFTFCSIMMVSNSCNLEG